MTQKNKIITNSKKTKLPLNLLLFTETPIPLAKQYVSSRCACGCIIELKDEMKNELVCPRCGLVKETTPEFYDETVVYGGWGSANLYTGNGYTTSEKEFMSSRNIKLKPQNMAQELNEMDYMYILDYYKQELCLSDVDIEDVKIVVRNCGGLKAIHRKLSYDKILLGVCRYILKKKGIAGYLVNLNNKVYRDIGLNNKDYSTIIENITKNGARYIWNT